ncbi:putative quinol monooxygenase [Actinomyces glycerinitolerans]|uniref:Antibiotic biosynthesis monooxygenase n=1 Tax=Actinomyces glycerinitolerans TaxID=1892869 RepID=A0A1M4RYA3_9ACTO|nr:putative quinol monooxygenase [Actinomyces glycerinitolerans]SHE24946.1 antibiotic biosynthesis monooxygenase [Actinomyces glycerinitolerans]
MIRIIATFTVRPDAVGEFTAKAHELVEGSRAEPGNISYELLRARDDATTLTFLEAWADDAAIETHNASAHFTTIIPQLIALSTGDPTIVQYEPA